MDEQCVKNASGALWAGMRQCTCPFLARIHFYGIFMDSSMCY